MINLATYYYWSRLIVKELCTMIINADLVVIHLFFAGSGHRKTGCCKTIYSEVQVWQEKVTDRRTPHQQNVSKLICFEVLFTFYLCYMLHSVWYDKWLTVILWVLQKFISTLFIYLCAVASEHTSYCYCMYAHYRV